MHGRVDCVKLMVEHKADLMATDVKGRTALMLAAFMGSHASVEILAKAGADTEAVCQIGRTPLLWACAAGPKGTDAVEACLNAGSNIDVRDRNGNNWEGRKPWEIRSLQPTCKATVDLVKKLIRVREEAKREVAEKEQRITR